MDPILYSAISDFKLPLPEKQPRELMIAQMFSLLLHHQKPMVPEDVLVYLENHHIYFGKWRVYPNRFSAKQCKDPGPNIWISE